MKDKYHNHVEDKSENISMLISELSILGMKIYH